jgi:hypothetical protein
MLSWLIAGGVRAQSPQPEPTPIDCWWRTSAGAVRIGEPFSFVLTCAVFDSDAVKVVPDQSRLDPSVAQMAPFEVLGGSHGPDIRRGDRRFFQYEYTLRLIGEDLFGKDVKLPETRIGYRIQSRVAQGAASEGRDRTYTLPPESIRVLSTVPADAAAIRDAPAASFAEIDERAFRASALRIAGGALLALGTLSAILALVKLLERYRQHVPDARRLVPDTAILRRVGRELSAVQREREGSGWTPELASRALASLRIAGNYAAHRPVGQTMASDGGARAEGTIAVPRGLFGRGRVLVSGSMTAGRLARARKAADAHGAANGRAAALDALEDALARFTRAQYGRGDGSDAAQGDAALDAAALDASLAGSRRVLRRLALDQTWVAKRIAAVGGARDRRGAGAWAD